MVAAQLDRRARPHDLTRQRAELETHNVHRRGFSTFSRSWSLSAMAQARAWPSGSTNSQFSTPISRAGPRLRSGGSGHVIITVAFPLRLSGTSGELGSISLWMPSSSNCISMRSLSWH